MNQKKYTAAVIGTGRIGFTLGFDRRREQPASHTMALQDNRRISVIAGCDTDAGHLEEWKAYMKHVAVYNNTAHLFAACRPDIVVVAVNENAHLETALEVLKETPRLVILEKPVALNMHDGLLISEIAVKYGVPVLVNHERRFAADYAAARQYMAEIGDIQSIHATLSSGLKVYSPKEEGTGEYSLLHDGTHLIDIVQYLLESIGEDTAGNQLQYPAITGIYHDKDDSSIIRNICVHYRTSVCPDVTFAVSGRSRYFGFDVDIRGTEGRICIGNGFADFYRRAESKLYTGFYSLEKDSSVKIPKKTGYFSNMVQNAVDFLDGKAELKSTLKNGLDTLTVIDEIRKKLKTGC